MPVVVAPKTPLEAVVSYFHMGFNFEALILRNQSGGAATLTQGELLGQPVVCDATKAALLAAADQATANGVIVDAPPAGITALADDADSSSLPINKVLVLRRGPALYRDGGLATVDAQGAAFTAATILAALKDEGVLPVYEATVSNVQTT